MESGRWCGMVSRRTSRAFRQLPNIQKQLIYFLFLEIGAFLFFISNSCCSFVLSAWSRRLHPALGWLDPSARGGLASHA